MPDSFFQVDPHPDADRAYVWVVRVRGELDAATAPELDARLREVESHNARLVILDLSETTFVDSSGLSLLLEVQRRMQNNQTELTVEGMSAAARRILEISGLLSTLAARHPR